MAQVLGQDLLLYKNTAASAEVVELKFAGVTSTGGNLVLSTLVGGEADQTIDTTGLTPTGVATAVQTAMDALVSYSATRSGSTVTITSLVNGEQEISISNASGEVTVTSSTLVHGKDAEKVDIAFATSNTLNMNVNLLDASVKQTAGWMAQIASQKSWDLSAEHLVSLDKTGDNANISFLFEMAETGEEVEFVFEDVNAGGTFTGSGIVSSLSVNAPNEELSTLSVTISGTGDLAFA